MRSPEERVAAYFDQALRGRRPRRFRAAPEEREALLGAALLAPLAPDRATPDPRFLDRLHDRLERELEPARPRRLVSRRALLGAAGSAVAAAAAGGLAGYGLAVRPRPARPAALAPDGARWIAAGRLADLPPGTARPFATGSMRLMLVNDGGRIRALSGACTHLGCLLAPADGFLACPCHHTTFGLDGSVLRHELPQAPPALPVASVRVVDGAIEVLAV